MKITQDEVVDCQTVLHIELEEQEVTSALYNVHRSQDFEKGKLLGPSLKTMLGVGVCSKNRSTFWFLT